MFLPYENESKTNFDYTLSRPESVYLYKGAANSGEALHRCRPDVVIKDNADKVDEGLQIIYSFDVGVDQWMTVRTQQKNK